MTLTSGPATLDLLAPDFRVNCPEVQRAAEQHWYAQSALGPVILRYEDCAELLHDRRIRQAGASHLADQGVTEGESAEVWAQMILNIDGPDHRRLRRLVTPAFAPSAVDRLRARMREIINDLIGRFAPAGRCEFVADFADQYPPQVMFDLLGVPADEHARFLRWGKDIAFLLSYGMAARRDQVDAAVAGICDATDRLCAQRRDDPGDDLLSALVAARDGDDRLTQEEIGAMVNILVLAGQDSTRCQLGMAMRLFAEHPEQWALLAERPELAPAAVEEVMRVAPVVPFVWRVADVDFDHHDLHLAASTRIWLSVGHAQQVGADGAPDPFDITAEHRPQLTFGHGAHYCLGAQLARVEMAEALPILARRLPGLALDGEGDWRPDLAGFVGPDRLPIRFTPTAA